MDRQPDQTFRTMDQIEPSSSGNITFVLPIAGQLEIDPFTMEVVKRQILLTNKKPFHHKRHIAHMPVGVKLSEYPHIRSFGRFYCIFLDKKSARLSG